MTPFLATALEDLREKRDWYDECEAWPEPRRLPPPPPRPIDPPDGAGDRFPRRPRPMAPAGAVTIR